MQLFVYLWGPVSDVFKKQEHFQRRFFLGFRFGLQRVKIRIMFRLGLGIMIWVITVRVLTDIGVYMCVCVGGGGCRVEVSQPSLYE